MNDVTSPQLLPHHHSIRPFRINDDIYRMTVLQFASDCTEDDIDQQFLRIAIELGITVPVHPQTTLDLIAGNVSALNLLDTDSDHVTPTSRFSQSAQSTSDSCSEQRSPTTASSTANESVTSPPSSIASVSSRRSSYISLRSGLRKISSIRQRRRRTIDAPLLALTLPITTIQTTVTGPRSPQQQQDRLTVESCPTMTLSCASSPIRIDEEEGRRPEEDMPSPTPFREMIECDWESRQRSLRDEGLRLSRLYQIEARDRFCRFESSQYRLMRLEQMKAKQALLERYQDRRQTMEGRHADALASHEHGHLMAEAELHRTLKLERQGCETRLRHMQAYCNPGFTIEGMPARTVTKKDRRQLEQQQHVCNGIDNLHASRINVLRERQAKQLERIAGKQEIELAQLADELGQEMQDLDAACEAEADQLRREFSERKERLVARWTLAEAIERRQREVATGEMYGPLPTISWGGGERESMGGEEDAAGMMMVV